MEFAKRTKEEGKTSLNVGEERRGVKQKARKEIYGSMSVTSASKSKFLAMVEPATPPPTTTIRFFKAIIISSRIYTTSCTCKRIRQNGIKTQ
jgi:hypothetical protein